MKPFHIMAKPHGPICNLDCTYCFYLEKENLYAHSGRNFRMSDASKEGTLNGNIDQGFSQKLSERENIDYNLKKIGEIGTSAATNGNYPLGWAQAANTPFKFWKEDANSEGGTHNPLIVFWPKGIKERGGIRTQYGHVIDVLPTTLDLVGVKAPDEIREVKQQPVEGTSLAYSIDNAKAPSRHTVQYYYIYGSRSIYDHGWKAEL